MRSNIFGDKYCTDSDEVTDAMNAKGQSPAFCYVDIEWDEDDSQWIAEIKDNATGDTVCYIEGFESRNKMREMLVDEVGFSNAYVNYI